MLGRRKGRKKDAGRHVEARDRAKEGLRESTEGLQEQRDKATKENREVIVPLRELRERNHFAELIIESIQAGTRREA